MELNDGKCNSFVCIDKKYNVHNTVQPTIGLNLGEMCIN